MKLNEVILVVMRELRRTFEIDSESGVYSIFNSEIQLRRDYIKGEWIIITGSRFNDGVYQLKRTLPDTPLLLTNGSDNGIAVEDEDDFQGTIWRLRLPRDFIALCKEINAFMDSPEGKQSAIVSENVVGVHSWSKATGKEGKPLGWQQLFGNRLSPWRRMFSTIKI